jgi:hypothetical protein
MFSREDLHFHYFIDKSKLEIDENNEVLNVVLDGVPFDQLITEETRRKIEEIESQEYQNQQMSYNFFNKPGIALIIRFA